MKSAVLLLISFAIFQSQVSIARAKAIKDTSDTSSSEEESDLTSKEEDCVDQLHLDKQFITELNNEEIAPEDNDDFNEFLNCYWQKEEWMESNGDVHYDKILHSLTEMAETNLDDEDPEVKSTAKKIIEETIAHCESNPPSKGNTNGQTAAKIRNCIMKKLKEMIVDLDLSSEEEASILSSKEEDCVEELHLDKHHIIKLNDREVVPESDDEFNKFLTCYWVKEEWMDNNGEINYDNLLFSLRAMSAIAYQGEPSDVKSMMKKRIARAISYCQNNASKGDSHGQTVAKLQNCITAKLNKGFYI